MRLLTAGLAIGGAAAAVAVVAAVASAASSPKVPDDYATDPEQPFGPYHKKRRPAGWPLYVATARRGALSARGDGRTPAEAREWAAASFRARHRKGGVGSGGKSKALEPERVIVRRMRPVGVRGGALPHIRAAAQDQGLGAPFVQFMAQFAKTEGEGGTFNVPARNFDARGRNTVDSLRALTVAFDGVRPAGRALITAAQTMQGNRDWWRTMHAIGGYTRVPWHFMPWDWSAEDEIVVPVRLYARIWREVDRIRPNSTPIIRARAARLIHTGPARYRRWKAAGFSDAGWRDQAADVTARIDRHIRHAGLT